MPGQPRRAAINRFFLDFGLAAVFGFVLLEQLGAPVPALAVVMLAGAKGAGDWFYLGYALVLAIVASVIGDLAWFWAGRRYGHRVLRLLCRVTLSPDSCVRQTETVYERRGAALRPAVVVAAQERTERPAGEIAGAGSAESDP